MFIPTLSYQPPTRAITKKQLNKIPACEMRYLRKAANITRRGRIRNAMAGTTSCLQHTEKPRIRWFGRSDRCKASLEGLQRKNFRTQIKRKTQVKMDRWSYPTFMSLFFLNGSSDLDVSELGK